MFNISVNYKNMQRHFFVEHVNMCFYYLYISKYQSKFVGLNKNLNLTVFLDSVY